MQIKSRTYFLIIIAGILLFTAVGCGSRNNQNIPVATQVAANRELEIRLEFSGVLLPSQTADISSRITGQVTTLAHKVGDTLHSGDVLMTLDTQSLEGQLLQAEANFQGAQAAAQIADNQAYISKTNLDAAQSNFDRIQTLFAAGAVSRSQLDDAQDKLDIASRQYQTASGPSRAQAEATANAAYANVKNLSVQLENTTIRSPIEGILTTQNVNVGQVVTSGTAVISIVDTSLLKLKSTVPQDQLARLKLGQELDINIDSYPGMVFKGTVTSIGPIAVSTGEVFPVEISLQNGQGLMAGLSAHSTLINKASGIILPLSSIQQSNGQNYVFVIKDNIAYQREVRTGLSNDREIEIISGLSEGERVAISNVGQLTDGKTVNAQ